MGPDAAFDLEIAAVVGVALLIVAVAVVAAWEGAGDAASNGTGRAAAVRGDVESALGGVMLMTYGQAATKKAWSVAPLPTPPEQQEEEEERCAFCLSEYAEADELVRVVPACGHFFHAECGVDGWLRARRTCPLCRGGLWPPPLPRLPRQECPPMPPRWSSPQFSFNEAAAAAPSVSMTAR